MELSSRFEWRGRSVAWHRLGLGPPVVMCHGTPWSSTVWSPFAEALSADFSVYLWDMPGYGQSSKQPSHDVDLGTQAELLRDILQYWELESPQVVAHDYGGAVSLRAHLLHGASYASLALVDVVALHPWGSDFFRLVAENAEVFAAQPTAIHRGALEAYIAGASHRGLSPEQMNALTEPWLSAEGQGAFYRQIAAADERYTDEIQDLYAAIDIPVKVIWGRNDTWIPADRATQLAQLIPGAELELIDNAGHLIQYDAPVQLATALQRWLTAGQ
ncbi:alpha/beta hydrolase [Saxibacter everestensis]|uniref:Alpha/beta hydrolase n=1 Tax=Saxibacter everestensis TaxID=2909229 RepID=A0ABY8QQJ0_9MICO|nr:alpha/beta hydrolase [Brevibacteriaceae bacterium ZFBP1038]